MNISVDETIKVSNPNSLGFEWRDDVITIPFKKTSGFNFQFVVNFTLPNNQLLWDNNNFSNYHVSCIEQSVETKKNLEKMLSSLGELSPDISTEFSDIFSTMAAQPEMKDLMNMMQSLLK